MAPQKTERRPTASAPSLISGDLRIIGDLQSDGEIQVDGFVEGDIRTKTLLVGESATIRGEVVADSIRVHGTVQGQIRARSVSLATSARVIGDIVHENLSIEKGAYLEGLCKRMQDRRESEPAHIVAGTATRETPLPPPPGRGNHPPAVQSRGGKSLDLKPA